MYVTRTKPCKTCGKPFHSSQQHRFYCSKECFDEMYKERKRIAKAQQEAKAKAKASGVSKNKNLETILHELEMYNRKHGTLISYGQWVAGVRAD